MLSPSPDLLPAADSGSASLVVGRTAADRTSRLIKISIDTANRLGAAAVLVLIVAIGLAIKTSPAMRGFVLHVMPAAFGLATLGTASATLAYLLQRGRMVAPKGATSILVFSAVMSVISGFCLILIRTDRFWLLIDGRP